MSAFRNDTLRRAAEARLKSSPAAANDEQAPRLMHEVELQRIELELQNEELMRARAELEAALGRYADWHTFAPLASLSIEPGGVVHRLNRAAAHLLAPEGAGLVGRRLTEFLDAPSRVAIGALVERAFASGAAERCEIVLGAGAPAPRRLRIEAQADAERRLLHAAMVEIDAGGEDAQRAARLERRIAEAEAAAHARDEFLAEMSREMRAPMDAIVGLARFAARDATDGVQQARLGRLEHAAHQLLDVVNDVFDLARFETREVEFEERDFALDKAVAAALERVGDLARARGVELRSAIGAPAALLRGDARRLSQALARLLALALRARAAGPLELSCHTLAEDDARLQLRFEVTGGGAPADAGGAGLALARRVAQGLGGGVGRGADGGFWLVAWFRRGQAAAPPPATQPSGSTPEAVIPHAVPGPAQPSASAAEAEARLRHEHGGRRILLADDNPVNLEVAAELLREAGLVVETVSDGAQAVQAVRGEHRAGARSFDLVLMDVEMPVMDGLEAARAIRAHGRAALPIVALTAGVYREERQACIDAGMNAHIGKPIDPARLYGVLLEWLPHHAAPTAGPAPAATAAPPLHERLAAVGGLDLDYALHNMGGRMAVYERVLGKFIARYRDGDPLLAGDLGENVQERWRSACHSQRGACAAIGARALETRLGEFEQTIKSGRAWSELEPWSRELRAELAAFVARLEQALDRGD